jgi:hypothetical protein
MSRGGVETADPQDRRTHRKDKTDMKKIYVKPMASGVAFVVNENIAASGKPNNLGLPGSFKLKNNPEIVGCNEVFSDTQIMTGFNNQGEEATRNPFDEIEDMVLLYNITQVIGNPAHPEYANYTACFNM